MRKHELKTTAAHASSHRRSIHPADWNQRFADCLMLLQPRTIALTVARHVAATDPGACQLEPEDAAARYIFEEHRPAPAVNEPH